jgi:hypothetical protein
MGMTQIGLFLFLVAPPKVAKPSTVMQPKVAKASTVLCGCRWPYRAYFANKKHGLSHGQT